MKRVTFSIMLLLGLIVLLGSGVLTATGEGPYWTWDDPANRMDGWACYHGAWIAHGEQNGGLHCQAAPDADGWRVELYYRDTLEVAPADDTISIDIWTETGELPRVCNSRALLQMAGVMRCAGARYPIEDLGNGWYRLYMHHPAQLNDVTLTFFWRPADAAPGEVLFDNLDLR